MFRKNISTAKRSVRHCLTMLVRTSRRARITYNGQDYEIKFPNETKIGFVEADGRKTGMDRRSKVSMPVLIHIDEADNCR